MRIFLTGFMGAGKTTVGRCLAGQLAVPFADLDAEIEAATGLAVRDIFELHGEVEFRQLEQEHLRRLCELPEVIVATGGGTLTVAGNPELIHRAGVSVWLNPSFSTLVERIAGGGKEDRPLFDDEVQAWQLYRQRLPVYQRCDLQVDVGEEEQPEEVAARIVLLVEGRGSCAT